MIQEALAFLADIQTPKNPVTVLVGTDTYAVKPDGTLGAPVRALAPQFIAPTFCVSTLTGIADLYAAGVDGFDTGSVGLHIVNHRRVDLVSVKADDFGQRHVYASATHQDETPFVFGKFYTSPEEFLIAFRASFYFDDEAVKVVQLCSAIGSGEAVVVNDDGLSQEVVVKTGTVTKASVPLPADGVALIPWRTFREVSPVQSRFLLRMKGVKDGLPQIALIEIDAKWQLDTKGAVRRWLEAAIPGAKVIA